MSQVVAPVGLPGGADVRESLKKRRILVWSVAESLTADERARAGGFVFPRDRNRLLTGRAFLRLLLAAHTGRNAAGLGHGWQVRHRRWSWIERGGREEGA